MNIRSWIKDDQNWRALSYALMIFVGIIMAVTFRDYGVGSDEGHHFLHGKAVIAWYTSFFKDRSATDIATFGDNVFYGRFFEVAALLIAKLLPFGFHESLHVTNCIFGLVGIAAAYKLGCHLCNYQTGFFSALFLTLTPMFYGHTFINAKDPQLATLYIISLYLIVMSYDHLPYVPKKLLAMVGLSIGLAMGVRPSAMILFGCAAACWLAWYVVQLSHKPFSTYKEARKAAAAIAASFLAVVGIGAATMLFWLPWAQLSPLKRSLEIVGWFTGRLGDELDGGLGVLFPLRDIQVVFDGHLMFLRDVPWNYLLTWLSMQLPEFFLISLLIGGAIAGSFVLNRKNNRPDSRKLVKLAILGLGILFPMTSAIILHSPIYNGMRHFLFIVPPLAVLGGISFSTLLRSRADWRSKAGITVLMAIGATISTIDMIQLHPYQYIYFNRLIAGGLKGANHKFETEYQRISLKEGVEWLVQNYHPDTTNPIKISDCSGLAAGYQTVYYLNEYSTAGQQWRYVEDDEVPNIYLTTTDYEECRTAWNGKVLHTVERQGVPLLLVIEVEYPSNQ